MSESEGLNWQNEAHDDGRIDFGFGPAHITLNVYGGNVMLAFGRDGMTLTQEQTITEGNWDSLAAALRGYAVEQGEIDELKRALDQDGQQIGDATRGWFGRLSEHVVSGALVGTTVPLILHAVRVYLGF